MHLDFDLRVRLSEFELDMALSAPSDGITAIFGPSGSGKSTLLRSLAGLEGAARGRITFADETWLDSERRINTPPHQRAVGYVFQDARLFPFLSVAGNLRYAERRSRHRTAAHGAAAGADDPYGIAAVTQALDLNPLMQRDTESLSGGERQRVAIGRTLLTRPRLLLMDEPLAANDIGRKADILPYIRRLPSRFGTPVIYVSHAIDEVAYLADHVVVMEGGRKVVAGDTATVFERLDLGGVSEGFEAGVVLAGRVVAHDDVFHLTRIACGEQEMTVPQIDVEAGRGVKLRVRARDVALATKRPQDISVRNVLEGTLVEIAADPATAFAETLVNIGGANLRARITRAAVEELALEPGRAVFALVKSVTIDDG